MTSGQIPQRGTLPDAWWQLPDKELSPKNNLRAILPIVPIHLERERDF